MKRRYIVISLLIVCLPLLAVGLLWEHLPLRLPLHFTNQGRPDRFGDRVQWLGMLASTTLFLAVIFRVMIHFLPHRLVLHPLRIGAVYMLSAVFIASLTLLLILKTLFVTPVFADLTPVLLTLYGSGLVYFSLPSFLPLTDETVSRRLSLGRLQALQKIYRLSRSVLVRVNAVIAVVMILARPDDRWTLLFLANLLALVMLLLWVSRLYRKAPETS
ncbi:DUF1648 domain-containing protein [Larkinella insperata]|uniref:DUF1648 domain-containing protein n=1 Tax=Larkinella insperata TaxID=332158 RepID=A0ABW3QBR7_9BACT|nr:DUF1648 domain-containing protein [Larkinella insperata]